MALLHLTHIIEGVSVPTTSNVRQVPACSLERGVQAIS